MTPSRNSSVTAHCGACGAPLPPGRTRRWCSDACRQLVWRRRHTQPSPTAELPAGRSARDHTIYECPECETRLVGVQRCQDCGTFMRRLGAGGTCRSCEEPITIDDLLGR